MTRVASGPQRSVDAMGILLKANHQTAGESTFTRPQGINVKAIIPTWHCCYGLFLLPNL